MIPGHVGKVDQRPLSFLGKEERRKGKRVSQQLSTYPWFKCCQDTVLLRIPQMNDRSLEKLEKIGDRSTIVDLPPAVYLRSRHSPSEDLKCTETKMKVDQ